MVVTNSISANPRWPQAMNCCNNHVRFLEMFTTELRSVIRNVLSPELECLIS